jgi:DNA-binding MltR family transcriptional regulator
MLMSPPHTHAHVCLCAHLYNDIDRFTTFKKSLNKQGNDLWGQE